MGARPRPQHPAFVDMILQPDAVKGKSRDHRGSKIDATRAKTGRMRQGAPLKEPPPSACP
ncbi:MAG: hypothetical protein BGO16_05600 [Nitrobacter sp. 62-23]|nr:MAG: hypothetical protein BGO16_05600 [Nitrobacter sp. 62-23]